MSGADVADYREERSHRRIGLPSLVVIGFFWVSGGIYGSEELLSAAPAAVVLSFTVGVALLFALPNALMTAECATAFPSVGGQVNWVSMACGSAVGGHNGYWVWLTNLLDAAVYPQLAAQYITHAMHVAADRQALLEAAITLTIVACICVINLTGIDLVTVTQAIAFALSLIPCLLFSGIGLEAIRFDHLINGGGSINYALLLSWAIWLYSGFSSLGAMAGEVEQPRRTYPAVVALLLPLVTTLNAVPFAVALSLDADRAHYAAGYFATLAGSLAGPWLRALFIAGANISLLGLYHSQILASERSLTALGQQQTRAGHHSSWWNTLWFSAPLLEDAPSDHPDGRLTDPNEAIRTAAAWPPTGAEEPSPVKHWLPPQPAPAPPSLPAPQPSGQAQSLPLRRPQSLSPPPPSLPPSLPPPPLQRPLCRRLWSWIVRSPSGGGAVPRCVILLNAMGAAALTQLLHYTSLVEVEMMLYACSHVLFLYSFVALRWLRPDAPRPFRLPGGVCVACLASALPLCLCVAVVGVNLRQLKHAFAFGSVLLMGCAVHAISSGSRLHRYGGDLGTRTSSRSEAGVPAGAARYEEMP